MMGSPVAANIPMAALSPVEAASARREPDRTSAHHHHEQDEGGQRRGLGPHRGRVDRHAGGDEEDRDEEAERQPLQLVLQALVPGRHQQPQHEAGGEGTEHAVQVERGSSHPRVTSSSTTRRTWVCPDVSAPRWTTASTRDSSRLSTAPNRWTDTATAANRKAPPATSGPQVLEQDRHRDDRPELANTPVVEEGPPNGVARTPLSLRIGRACRSRSRSSRSPPRPRRGCGRSARRARPGRARRRADDPREGARRPPADELGRLDP